MALDATKWDINVDKSIRYIGGALGSTAGSATISSVSDQ